MQLILEHSTVKRHYKIQLHIRSTWKSHDILTPQVSAWLNSRWNPNSDSCKYLKCSDEGGWGTRMTSLSSRPLKEQHTWYGPGTPWGKLGAHLGLGGGERGVSDKTNILVPHRTKQASSWNLTSFIWSQTRGHTACGKQGMDWALMKYEKVWSADFSQQTRDP